MGSMEGESWCGFIKISISRVCVHVYVRVDFLQGNESHCKEYFPWAGYEHCSCQDAER